MTERFCLKGGSNDQRLSRGRAWKGAVIFGLVSLAVLLAWQWWRAWRPASRVKSLPPAGERVFGRIPRPRRATVAGPTTRAEPAPEGTASAGLEVELAMVARAPAQPAAIGEKGPQEAGAEVRKAKSRSPGSGARRTEKPRHGGIIIQVGAFRQRATARKLEKLLREKGYEAYVDARLLPRLGLLYRVRLRGYPDVAAARSAMKRLQNKEGLESFILRPTPEARSSPSG